MKKLLPEMFRVNGTRFSLIRRQNNFLLYVCRKKEKIQGFEIIKSLFVGPDGLPAISERNAVETLPPITIRDVNHWQLSTRSAAVKKFNELCVDAARKARLARRIVYQNGIAQKRKLPEKIQPKTKTEPETPLLFPEYNAVAEQLLDVKRSSDEAKKKIAERKRLLKEQFMKPEKQPVFLVSRFYQRFDRGDMQWKTIF